MKNLTAIIVDDEEHAQELLQSFVHDYKGVFQVKSCQNNLLDAVSTIKKNKPDVVFLDVEMPLHSGTKIGEFLKPHEMPVIIFVTAYKSFAIDAIKLGAFDYILKPIDRKELFDTLNKLIETLNDKRNKVNNLLKVSTIRGIELIQYDDILYLEASGSYTEIVLDNKKLISSKPIKYYEQTLVSEFIRTHRTYIVNIKEIKSITKGVNNWFINLNRSNTLIPISRKYKSNIKFLE